MDLYAENILDHYRHPRRKGELPGADIAHEETNVSCGDTLTVRLCVADGRIADIGWDGAGCAISQAGMSLLAEDLPGKTLEDIDALTEDGVRELLGVPIGLRRAKCAFLGLEALRGAVAAYRAARSGS